MGYGIEGKKIRLVPLDYDRHFENALRWINDLDSTTWIGMQDMPISRLAEKDWFEARARAGNDEFMWAIETLNGGHIGFSNLFKVSYISGNAESGSMIGDASHRGKGLGTDAARVRAWFAFECLGLRTLYSAYIEGNEASARMQAAVGYEIWGRCPDAIWKRGQHRAMVHTYLTREKWLKLREG